MFLEDLLFEYYIYELLYQETKDEYYYQMGEELAAEVNSRDLTRLSPQALRRVRMRVEKWKKGSEFQMVKDGWKIIIGGLVDET